MVMREPVAMEIPAVEESAAGRMPPRIRRRLLEGSRVGGGAPTSAEEIEAKLKEAELRRQVGVPVRVPFPSLFFCCFRFVLRGGLWGTRVNCEFEAFVAF